MADIEIVMDWVDKAEEDFQFAVVNLKDQKPFYAQICFHFHQAAEKYLKAYVVANELEFRKVHDLPLLLRICSVKDSTLEALGDACEYLNAFYVETRYPVHWPTNFSYEESEKSLKAADRIRSLIKEKIDVNRRHSACDS